MSRRKVVGETPYRYGDHGTEFILECGHKKRGYHRWTNGACSAPKTMQCPTCKETKS